MKRATKGSWTNTLAKALRGEIEMPYPEAFACIMEDMYAATKRLRRGTCPYCWYPHKGPCGTVETPVEPGSHPSRPPRPARRRAPAPNPPSGFDLPRST